MNERNKREGKCGIETIAWTDRRFTVDLPTGLFPKVLERLRGTPARSCDLVSGAQEKLLRMLRVALVREIELLTEEQTIRTALHPRLQRSLRVLVATVQRLSLPAEGT